MASIGTYRKLYYFNFVVTKASWKPLILTYDLSIPNSPNPSDQLARACIANQKQNMVESAKSWAMPPAWSVKKSIPYIINKFWCKAYKQWHACWLCRICGNMGNHECVAQSSLRTTIMYINPWKVEQANQLVLQGVSGSTQLWYQPMPLGSKAIFKT